jgi:hypothetical protein
MHSQVEMIVLSLLLCFQFTYQVSIPASIFWIHSSNISLSLDSNTGEMVSLNTSSGLILDASGSMSFLGDTSSDPILLNVSINTCGTTNEGVCVSRWLRVVAQHSNASCCESYDLLAVTSFFPYSIPQTNLPSSISWRLDITSSSLLPWRTKISHILNVTGPTGSSFWTPRGGNSSIGWQDVLRMANSNTRPSGFYTQFGINMLFDDNPTSREVSSVPAAVLSFDSAQAGIGLIQSLDDHIFGLAIDVLPNFIALNKYYNRLGQGRTISLTTFLVPLVGIDWRPLFLWARGAMPRFFLSSTLLADATRVNNKNQQKDKTQISTPIMDIPKVVKTGLGMYTCANIEDVNLTEIRLSGATHNWDAHFEWPYIGMYLPPITPFDANWTSNLGSGEEPNCGSWSHGQQVNISMINSIYKNAANEGITTLTYFNVVEYGENFACPLPLPISPPPVNDWINSSQFAANHMPNSPWPGCPNTGWQNGVDLNPADLDFQSFLINQTKLHINSFGDNFFGFAIDRFDHSTQWYNPAPEVYDDYLAWCGAPCFPMLTAMNVVFNRIAQLVYSSSGRLITANFVGSQRVDSLQWLDGIFEEDYLNHIQLVLTSGFATTGMPPAMIWTYDANEVLNYSPNTDAYFAQHVLYKASPFAPVLGNDHSIQPQMDMTGRVQSFYTDWGPFFSAFAGGCWWLVSEPVRVETASGGLSSNNVELNAFSLGGGCTDVSTASGTGPVSAVILVAVASSFTSKIGDTVVLSMADAFEMNSPSTCESLTPGNDWMPIDIPTFDIKVQRWVFNAPLAVNRGALMVKCNR